MHANLYGQLSEEGKRGRREEGGRKEGGRREERGVVAYITDSLIHEGERFQVSTTPPYT